MNFKNLKIILPLVAVIGLIGIGGFFLGQTLTTNLPTTTVNSAGASYTHVGYACYKVRKAGEPASVLYEGYDTCSHNVYTNFGKNATVEYLFGAAASKGAFTVISVGVANNSQTSTDRCIANLTGAGAGCEDYGTNGFTPIAGTMALVRSGGGIDFGNVSITTTFTCTSCSSTVINATGLYNATTFTAGGNNTNAGGLTLFAEANFTAATLQTNDQINVTWFIWTN
jgi:hypothetical protein